MRSYRVFAAGGVVTALLAGLVGGGVGFLGARLLDGQVVRGDSTPARPVPLSRPAAEAAALPPGETIVRMVEQVGPAVISINTVSRSRSAPAFPFPFPEPGGVRRGQGSGFIIDSAKRHAVTNSHVVEAAERIRVTLPDKRTFPAKVVGKDPIGDIALIHIEGDGELPQVSLGDSAAVRIGQVVVAIGNPLGLENTVTQGVLSAVGRQLPEGRVRTIPLEDLLQTDAAINPGNSGGPLLDASGRVIGMNTAMLSQAQGIGFAVAANSIRRSVSDLLEHGRVIRPWIGVLLVELSPEVAREMGTTQKEGAAVYRVNPNGPAYRAGLRGGDVITRADGATVTTTEEVRNLVRGVKPGEEITLSGSRGNTPRTWKVKVGELPPVEKLGQP